MYDSENNTCDMHLPDNISSDMYYPDNITCDLLHPENITYDIFQQYHQGRKNVAIFLTPETTSWNIPN